MAVRDDFAPGEVLPAADLNDTFASKADTASPTFTGTVALPATVTIDGVSIAWQSWTPSFNNFTLGNGTVDAASYIQIGDLVHAIIRVTLGSTSAVATDPQISLPVTASSDYFSNLTTLGVGLLQDTGANQFYGVLRFASTTFVSLRFLDTSGAAARVFGVNATSPFTWGSTDVFSFQWTYKAA